MNEILEMGRYNATTSRKFSAISA